MEKGEKDRNIDRLPPECLLMGIEVTAQACALSRNPNEDFFGAWVSVQLSNTDRLLMLFISGSLKCLSGSLTSLSSCC